ncbi:GAF domain-containing protein [Sphingomonas sp. RHCKR7]|uniref:GAF domain-containing protein n=1 Tax=Sphingomonas folli TaxID=2862497 RepID=UPI001C67AC92|nr:GAF domain-containing protein [Sphingomonas folli]MBW6526921.1 GAF domain-containing protein [Sphingomonas folli]
MRADWEGVAEELDEIAAAAAGLIGTPAALVTIVDERMWVAGRFNTRLHGLERQECVCAHGIAQSDRVLCIPDLQADARFAAMPIAQGPEAVRFYVGAPLVGGTGAAFGMLCAVDQSPRAAPPEQQCRALQRLARAAAARLAA